eukprot:GEZU01022351.1.p1 GENE.GEZU01022351.1~~GEZU01022351.1.p1  ORF type:complete len:407 (-),score=121.40 GEZU01022351.1:1213-2433(-)
MNVEYMMPNNEKWTVPNNLVSTESSTSGTTITNHHHHPQDEFLLLPTTSAESAGMIDDILHRNSFVLSGGLEESLAAVHEDPDFHQQVMDIIGGGLSGSFFPDVDQWDAGHNNHQSTTTFSHQGHGTTKYAQEAQQDMLVRSHSPRSDTGSDASATNLQSPSTVECSSDETPEEEEEEENQEGQEQQQQHQNHASSSSSSSNSERYSGLLHQELKDFIQSVGRINKRANLDQCVRLRSKVLMILREKYAELERKRDDIVQKFNDLVASSGIPAEQLDRPAMEKKFHRLCESFETMKIKMCIKANSLLESFIVAAQPIPKQAGSDAGSSSGGGSSKSRKNRNLPEHAKKILQDWFLEHYDHPYPTEAEKSELSAATGLVKTQINNWFINTRVRMWRPIKQDAKAQKN